MKKLHEPLKRKYLWAILLSVFLTVSTTYTLLDALVIPKSYSILNTSPGTVPKTNTVSMTSNSSTMESPVDNSATSNSAVDSASAETNASAEVGDNSYKDDNISISIETVNQNGAVYYVADVQISDISYMKTAFANNTFGKNITQTTSAMAQANNAIFAVNGDYYGFRDTGLIIRNGQLYRDNARSSPDNQALVINSKGELEIVTEGETDGNTLVAGGAEQSFSFGPVLAQDGERSISDIVYIGN